MYDKTHVLEIRTRCNVGSGLTLDKGEQADIEILTKMTEFWHP